MKNEMTETNAAAQAAGRELSDSAPHINPFVAIAATALGPILGLLRRLAKPSPTTVRKVRLESYSSSPVTPPSGRRTGARRATAGRPALRRGASPGVVRVRAYVRALPRNGVNNKKGGRSHG
jgi:hypothetical protein